MMEGLASEAFIPKTAMRDTTFPLPNARLRFDNQGVWNLNNRANIILNDKRMGGGIDTCRNHYFDKIRGGSAIIIDFQNATRHQFVSSACQNKIGPAGFVPADAMQVVRRVVLAEIGRLGVGSA